VFFLQGTRAHESNNSCNYFKIPFNNAVEISSVLVFRMSASVVRFCMFVRQFFTTVSHEQSGAIANYALGENIKAYLRGLASSSSFMGMILKGHIFPTTDKARPSYVRIGHIFVYFNWSLLWLIRSIIDI
jgi:hypothetical protein